MPRSAGSPLPAGRAALEERPAGKVLAVDLEEAEDAVDDRVRGDLPWRGRGGPEALLEPAEGRLPAVVRDHLAVEQEVPCPLRRHRGTDLGVGNGEVLAGSRLEPHVVAVFARAIGSDRLNPSE